MELKQIKELMLVMGRSGTKRLTLKKEGFELTIEQSSSTHPLHESPLQEEGMHTHRKDPPFTRSEHALTRGGESSTSRLLVSPPPVPSEEPSPRYVMSPMVGTFYPSPSPDASAFVKIGDRVEKQTVVCIIEAMKVMNEVKAGVSGIISEVLVENGQPVEFGSKLFSIADAGN